MNFAGPTIYLVEMHMMSIHPRTLASMAGELGAFVSAA
jgi:hypothetical protein